jgi:hypothetical protein
VAVETRYLIVTKDPLTALLATVVIHIVAILMTCIMIYHIKSKYTAVGRKEIVMFFYLYMLVTFVQMLLDSGWIAAASSAYPVSKAVGKPCERFTVV